MKLLSLAEELKGNAYPGRGIVIGKSKDEFISNTSTNI